MVKSYSENDLVQRYVFKRAQIAKGTQRRMHIDKSQEVSSIDVKLNRKKKLL